jgi:hypothetical protein
VRGAGEEEEGPASDSVPVSPVGTGSTGSGSSADAAFDARSTASGAALAMGGVLSVEMGREVLDRAADNGISCEAGTEAVGVTAEAESTLVEALLVGRVNGFFLGDTAPLLPATLGMESVLLPLDMVDVSTFFSRLIAGTGIGVGVGSGKARVFFVSGIRLDLLRVAAGAGIGAARTAVRPLPIGLPQLADPGSAAADIS